MFYFKKFIEQLQQGFSDSTQKAGSDRIKQIGKMLDQCITINIQLSN